jgi:hypothetical protein
MTAYGERIVRVEVELQDLRKAFDEHKDQTNEKFTEINTKLDSLLALRNKGAGIFWLMSSLIGAGIIGGAVQLFHWLVGTH